MQNDYLGALSTSAGNNDGVDWHFDASTNELAQLADHTQIYNVVDQTNNAANQTINISIGANDQFQFSSSNGNFAAGSGAHDC